MSTPAALCDPFAALLLHRKEVNAKQASLGESVGPITTTTDMLPLSLQTDSHLSKAAVLPAEAANELTYLHEVAPVGCDLQPSSSSNSAPTSNNTNETNQAMSANMEPAMSQRVVEALHKFIQEERLHNFDFLGSSSHHYMEQEELLVVSTASQEHIEEALSGHQYPTACGDHGWFTFRQMANYDCSYHTVMITSAPGVAVSVDAMIIIEPHWNGSFTSAPAVTWMLDKYTLEDEGAMKFPEQQYDEQFLWWSNNKKVFPLLALPPELRDAIYLQIIGPVILPDLHGPQTIFGRGLSYERTECSQRSRDPDIEAPNMSIMRVNRQVWREATKVATRDSQKRLRMVETHHTATAKRGPSSSLAHIAARWLASVPHTGLFRKLQLEMSATAYFESIGIKPTPQNPLASTTGTFSLDTLRNFTSLQELDFRFIGPKHPDAVCPWALISQTHDKGEHSCQKLWIDYFFVLGWDTLRPFREKKEIRITLSGCVKTSSQQYWEHVLNTKNDSHTSTVRAAEMRIRQQKTDNLPIACQCSNPCSKAEAEMGKTYRWSQYDIEKIAGLQDHIDDIYWSFKD